MGTYPKTPLDLHYLVDNPVRTKPEWPIWDKDGEKEILSGAAQWKLVEGGRGTKVSEFEKKYAELMGANRCLATASGTTALLIALHVLGIDAGDDYVK